MNACPKPFETLSDQQLWERSRSGDRDAFGAIVERYQTLVCSLAFSACGDLARSEDLAQETFLAAWRNPGGLREPAKLRAWLGGIVRNLAADFRRRERRRGGPVEPLEAAADPVAADADPASSAVSREEEALLWRTLGDLPDTYREPMVLYYREQRSMAEVSRGLGISEDAVKQRLSRGRSLLRDELAAWVEAALLKTRPGASFAAGVMSAIPMLPDPVPAAGVTSAAGFAAGKGLVAGVKTTLGGLGAGAIVGPLIGLGVGWITTRLAASTGRSDRERACLVRTSRVLIFYCFALSIALALSLGQVGKLYQPSPGVIFLGITAWLGVLLGGILTATRRLQREVEQIRTETGTQDDRYSAFLESHGMQPLGPVRFVSRGRFLGMRWWDLGVGGLDAGSYRPHRAVAWIAAGDVAVSPLFAFGGIAVAPVALGGVTVGVLSLSLWGLAAGVLAVGSVALGWWAFGIAAVAWRGAWGGGVAVARDYGLGGWVSAAEANTPPAQDWFQSLWFGDAVAFYLTHVHWLIIAIIVASLVALARRAFRLRTVRTLEPSVRRP